MREEGTLFQPGQLVANGHFRVLRLLGSGATSHVYAAEPAANPGARVALKVLRRSFAHHSIALRRFQREAAVVQLVKSRFVARFLGAGLDEAKCIWMAFELFEGDSLERLLPQGRCDLLQGSDDIRWVVRDVLQGLDAAHKAQIVHRDIKPSNIFRLF